MKAIVSQINEFQKHLFWFSNFPGAAILNNWDVPWLPYCFKRKALDVKNNNSNHNTSKLFKRVVPEKFESEKMGF